MFLAIMLLLQHPAECPGRNEHPVPPQQFSPVQPVFPVLHEAKQHTVRPCCAFLMPVLHVGSS